jgi:hypothetical protein
MIQTTGGEMYRSGRIVNHLLVAWVTLSTALVAHAGTITVDSVDASAYAGSGRFFINNSSSSSVWFGSFTWAQTAVIKWTVPTFTADGGPLPTTPVPFNECKYAATSRPTPPPGGPPPCPKVPLDATWLGYSISGTGTKGSTATSTGSGSSTAGSAFYGASWTVTANGTGTYDVVAVATDPWDIFPSDFSTITGSTYDLYIPFSMFGGQSDTTGSTTSSAFEFDVDYTTASGSITLADVTFNGTSAVFTPSASLGSSLQFYLEPNSTTAPAGSAVPGTPISNAALQSLISGDIDANGNLKNPINLGVVLNGIPIPTGILSDGSVAQIDVVATAEQSAAAAATPEPSTLFLVASGLAGSLSVKRRMKAR